MLPRILVSAAIAVAGLPNDLVLADPAHALSQPVQVQPVMERGTVEADNTVGLKGPAQPAVEVSVQEFQGGPNPKWIWGPDNNADYVLQTAFSANNVSAAILKASCDNVGTVFINDRQVTTSSEWQEPMSVDVTQFLIDGKNNIRAKVGNQGGVAAFVLKLTWKADDGKVTHVVSDQSWTIDETTVNKGDKVALRGDYGDGPWGNVFDNAGSEGRVPQGVFEVLPGFQVEKLFTVPKEELGSWVCIAFDNKGRLLASDQGDKGICRVAVPPVGPSGRRNAEPQTTVERLHFSKCEHQPSGAQGMLWAFDSLYLCCNGGPGSGLYRARDTDGDDQFDECVKLKAFNGGGEHGPHSIRLSPDGKRIFVIAGNHTDPPFQAGEELKNENDSSRVPTNWGEDHLLPRMWDANGHARGKLAPGGWIASTDPDGKTWEIWSIGYRNPYDMAFNADGELFAYDADMEWDVGTPWYRPTRVVHATSGSEFGWRSGTGKWPTYYLDSLPPLINIGPGSPVGVDFGYGLKFPAKYQRALYICDWTFGTMYAIHMEPHQSSYKATKEEFVSRSPLPLTDVAAGPDGALYFSVGGRGTQSELYRVCYDGRESTEPAEANDIAGADDRAFRHAIEKWHPNDTLRGDENFRETLDQRVYAFESALGSSDRFLRFAAMRTVVVPYGDEQLIAMPHSPLASLQIQLSYHTGLFSRINTGMDEIDFFTQLPPIGPTAVRANIVAEGLLSDSNGAYPNHELALFKSYRVDEKLDYLRMFSLLFTRTQAASESGKSILLAQLEDEYPSDDWRLNRELCQMLVYLKSPTVVVKTIELMNQPPQHEDIDMGELLTRNRGYGRAINAMIDNQPDKQQMWYAYCLRVAEVGWTPKLRADYYRWFGRAQTWSGGNSFKKFLQNIEDEAWQKTPFDHRVLVEKMGARTPYTIPKLPKPVGPGKDWMIENVRQLAADGLKNRDFANGQKMFAATRCVVCHRFAGDGGATGPDLTQLAGRFNIEALTEAIMDPSKIISDQYKASTVVTTSGKTINGRIVSENEAQISVLTDPEDSSKVVDIPKAEIDETLPSQTSIMPANLLKPLNQDEVLDLLAYLLSRGDEKHPMFRKDQ